MAEAPYPRYPPCFAGACGDPTCCARGFRWNWPETVGKSSVSATKLIGQTNPLVTVVKPAPGQVILTDFCCNRVYLFVDGNDNIVRVPVVG